MDELRIEYIPLGELKRWERNPKDHDLGTLGQSLSRFGYVMPILIDERSGKVAAGHGRIDALQMKKDAGEKPPARVTEKDGDWQVPVIRGVSFNSDGEMEAYAVADNRVNEIGGWDEPKLLDVLKDLPDLDGVGFDAEDLSALALTIGDTLLEPPEDFKEYDESVDTEYKCPKCGYEWSGKPK